MGQRSGFVGRRVVGAIVLLAMQAGCLGMAGIKPTAAGEVREFPDANLRFVMQDNGTLELARQWGGVRAPLLTLASGERGVQLLVNGWAEQPGSESNSDTVLRDAASGFEKLAKEYKPEPVRYREFGGVPGRELAASGLVEGKPLEWLTWVASYNGYQYRMVALSIGEPKAGQATFVERARPMLEGFGVMDRSRLAFPGATPRFTGHVSAPYAYAFAPRGDYRAWKGFRENFDAADTGTLAGQWEGAVVIPALLVSPDVPLDAVTFGLLDAFGSKYPVENSTVTPLEHAGLSGQVIRYAYKGSNGEYDYKLHVLRSGAVAWLVAAWNVKGESSLDEHAARVLEGFRPQPMQPARLADLPPEERKKQASILNGTANWLFDANRAEESIAWYRAAVDAAPEQLAFVRNLLGAWNRAGRHIEALQFLDTRPTLLKDDVIRGWRAWHRNRAGDKDGALADYRDVFLDAHDDDDDFLAYVDLLVARKEWAEVERAFTRQLGLTKSLKPRLREVRYLVERGEHARALDVLERLKRTNPDNGDIAWEIRKALTALDRHEDALRLADTMVERAPKDGDAWWARGQAQLGLHRWADARKSLEQARSLGEEQEDGDGQLVRLARAQLDELKGLLGERPSGAAEPPLAPVPLPREVVEQLAKPPVGAVPTGASHVEFEVRGIQLEPGGGLRRTDRVRLRFVEASSTREFRWIEWETGPLVSGATVNECVVRDAAGAEVWRAGAGAAVVVPGASTGDLPRIRVRLPRLVTGGSLEWVLTRTFQAAPGHATQRIALGQRDPVRRAIVYFSGDPKKLAHVASNLPPPQKLSGGGLAWTVDALSADGEESLDVPEEAHRPVLWVGEATATWTATGEALAKRIGAFAPPTATIVEAARGLVKDAGSPAEKVRILFNHVRGFDMEDGPNGAALDSPHAPDEVLVRGEGSCLEHALLLRALLAAVGIESNVALLARWPVHPQPATVEPFTHAVLRVPSLDFTLDTAADESLPLGDSGQHAGATLLVLAPGASRLETARVSPTDRFKVAIERSVRVDGDELVVDETLRSEELAAGWARGFVSRGPAGLFSAVQELFSSELPGVSLLQVEEVAPVQADAGRVVTWRVKYRVRGAVTSSGRSVVLPPAPLELAWVAITKAERRGPFEVKAPIRVESVTRLPGAAGARPLPEVVDQGTAGPGRWSGKRRVEGDAVVIEYTYENQRGRHPASAFAEFQRETARGLSFLTNEVVLQK